MIYQQEFWSVDRMDNRRSIRFRDIFGARCRNRISGWYRSPAVWPWKALEVVPAPTSKLWHGASRPPPWPLSRQGTRRNRSSSWHPCYPSGAGPSLTVRGNKRILSFHLLRLETRYSGNGLIRWMHWIVDDPLLWAYSTFNRLVGWVPSIYLI